MKQAQALDPPRREVRKTGRKRGSQETGSLVPGLHRSPKARKTWPGPPDPARPHRSSSVQGPTMVPKHHRSPHRVEGPTRRSPRLAARQGQRARPEPDPPPKSKTRGLRPGGDPRSGS